MHKIAHFRFLISCFFRLVLLLVVLNMAACGRGESNVESGNRLGIFHTGNGAEPQGLDPHAVSGVPEHHIVDTLFEGLVYKDPATLEIVPGVAQSWTISDDGKIYTFQLRDNAKWSNGDAVTAHDFAWSWWRGLQPEIANVYVFMFFPIKNAEKFYNQEITDFSEVGVTVLDDLTLRVELTNPTPYFLQLLDHYSTFPVHRPTIEKHGKPHETYTGWARPGNLVGNGAFVLDEWRLNRHVIVSKSDTYWDADRVKLNKIKFYPIDLRTVEERMFRAGQLHNTDEAAIERLPFYRENYPQRVKIDPYLGTYLYRINTTKEGLNDVRVRKALAMTVDRDTLIRQVLNGIFTPAYSVTPPGLLGYQPPKTFEYNPEEARRLLAQAGYPNGEGFPTFELQYNTHDQHRKVAIAIQQMWKKELNIDVRLQNKDWKVYLDDESSGNFEISRGGWIGDYVDPNTFLDMWTSDSGVNRTRWKNKTYDDLVLKQAPEAQSQAERFALFYKAEEMLLNDMPFIPIYTYSSSHFRHESVQGIPSNLMNYYNFRYVSLDPNWDETKSTEQGGK